RRVEAVFDEAVDLAPADRPAFLARACAGDAECRREVGVMLGRAEQSGITAKLAGAVAASAASRSTMAPGQTVSQYELIEQMGGGGMGIVFKALDPRLVSP